MDFDAFKWRGEVVRVRQAFGYTKKLVTGEESGLHEWQLSSGCLPDDEAYGNLIDGLPRFQYYWDFFEARMNEGDGVFIVPFRGKNYHASFAETKMSAEVFTLDLFGGGVTVRQRRIRSATYDEDGAIVE